MESFYVQRYTYAKHLLSFAGRTFGKILPVEPPFFGFFFFFLSAFLSVIEPFTDWLFPIEYK